MPVEFEMEINVQTSTRRGYRTFIENLRVRLGVRFSHNCPVLADQPEGLPTRFFDLVLRTNDHSVRFRLRMDNLYLIGYQMENGQWLEFNNTNGEHLILEQRTAFLGFNVSYRELTNVAGLNMEQIRVGFYNLGYGINQLATSAAWNMRAHYLIVVAMMISESTRLNPISEYMAACFDNLPGTSSYDYDNSDNRNLEGQILSWIMDLVRSWGSFSTALLRADADPGQSFQLRPNRVRIPPHNWAITNLFQAEQILGILLGRCVSRSGPGRFRRLTSDEGQCFLGLPLVEVFSVRIDDIDEENPGELYGTITVNDGLNIEYIYNRTSSNPESIKPGHNASLTGPSQSILAIGNFSIKLLLTDRDIVSSDDEIINQEISWDASEIGNVQYDEPKFQKLDGINGSVTVNYAVLRDAVAAKITVVLGEGGENPADVYGQVHAHYDNWENPHTCLLFNTSSGDNVDVGRWQAIPLLRSVVAVPLNRNLIVEASLYDHDIISGDDEIAKGAVEFPAATSGTSCQEIRGEDGNYVQVKVDWTSEI